MPITSTSLDNNLSGAVVQDGAFRYVTYDATYLGPTLNNEGNLDQIPSIGYLGGEIHYKIDSQGNVWAVTLNRDGSSPI